MKRPDRDYDFEIRMKIIKGAGYTIARYWVPEGIREILDDGTWTIESVDIAHLKGESILMSRFNKEYKVFLDALLNYEAEQILLGDL